MFSYCNLFMLFFLMIAGIPLFPLEVQSVTLDEVLAAVMENNPFFDKEKLNTKIAEKERDAYLGDQDWLLSAIPQFARQNPLPPSSFAPKQIDQLGLNLGASRLFWRTGGRLSFQLVSDFSEQKGLENIVLPFGTWLNNPAVPDVEFETGPPTYYQSRLLFSYSQPLFQNFSGTLDRLGFEVSQTGVDIAYLQVLENEEQYLLQIAEQFLQWVLLGEQKRIAQERLKLAAQQLERAREKRAAQLIDEVDVLRSEDAVRIAEQGVVLINSQWKGKQTELAVLTQWPELIVLVPDYDLYNRHNNIQPDDAVKLVRERSRVLRILAAQTKQLERQKEGIEELVKPQLYLNTQYTLKDGGVNFNDAYSFSTGDLGIGLTFSYPLGNRTAARQSEKFSIMLKQLQYTNEEVAISLEAGLRNLMIQSEEIEKALDLNKLQIATANRKTGEEQKRYNQGRSDLAFVIQSQDSEEQARLTYAENAARYQLLQLKIKELMDELLSDNTDIH